ncbi:hypothetical protein A0H81_09955 [Grifola frondosa]|uniref:Uncharacterized protein n=1 Tax=Grifola frondosa TaxID=5627 RepID=A0A1C7LZ95_GRIFR|nr:hypothetical protein A0H81_09955 [Grifola frondosa]
MLTHSAFQKYRGPPREHVAGSNSPASGSMGMVFLWMEKAIVAGYIPRLEDMARRRLLLLLGHLRWTPSRAPHRHVLSSP